jgi:chemotaxis protein MotA
MFIIIGIVVVFGAVVGGFLMEHGNLKVLMQPAELVTIGGAALRWGRSSSRTLYTS